MAYHNLYSHYPGPNHVQHQAAQAESALQNAHYHCERKRFTFDSYVTIHKKKHQILENLAVHG